MRTRNIILVLIVVILASVVVLHYHNWIDLSFMMSPPILIIMAGGGVGSLIAYLFKGGVHPLQGMDSTSEELPELSARECFQAIRDYLYIQHKEVVKEPPIQSQMVTRGEKGKQTKIFTMDYYAHAEAKKRFVAINIKQPVNKDVFHKEGNWKERDKEASKLRDPIRLINPSKKEKRKAMKELTETPTSKRRIITKKKSGETKEEIIPEETVKEKEKKEKAEKKKEEREKV